MAPRLHRLRNHDALAQNRNAQYHPRMTHALERAFDAASRLAERDQDDLAAVILAEIQAGERSDATLTRSSTALERLAGEALEEHRAGRTEPLDSEPNS